MDTWMVPSASRAGGILDYHWLPRASGEAEFIRAPVVSRAAVRFHDSLGASH